jgi:hypothetical protein
MLVKAVGAGVRIAVPAPADLARLLAARDSVSLACEPGRAIAAPSRPGYGLAGD